MQRSSIFVVYRDVPLAKGEVLAAIEAGTVKPSADMESVDSRREYIVALDTKDAVTHPGVGLIGRHLKDAIQLDRNGAFRMAVGLGAGWAAGELVSTKKGVHVDE